MKRYAPYGNIACLACILGMHVLLATAQGAASSTATKAIKIIDCGGGGWKDGQVQEPCILVNPKDAGKLIMFYAGMKTKWANYSDQTMYHVATPALYHINGKWYLYFQAARAGGYSSQHWNLWGIQCDDAAGKLLSEGKIGGSTARAETGHDFPRPQGALR